jgi:hypothetical protein
MKRGTSPTVDLAVSHPALRALLARWRAHRGTSAMPSRDDLPFINLLPWSGHIRRVEIGRGFEPSGSFLDGDCRRAATTGMPVRGTGRSEEMLVLPFSGPDQRVQLLLVCRYAALAENADERRNQKREQRRAHEVFARGALEKA